MLAMTFVREEEKMARHALALWVEALFFLDFFGSFWGNAKKNVKK